jgi:uncharacterized delta-60 repeat protein
MSHRNTKKPVRASESRPGRGRRTARRPALERLEGRTLLSFAGSPDLTFGPNGYTSILEYDQYLSYSSAASVLQSNGDLVVVGGFSSSSVGELSIYSLEGFHAMRYQANGTLDPNFENTLPGVSSLNVTVGGIIPIAGYSGATGVALESNGQIVVVGDVDNVAKVIMLNSDGTLDTSFGTDGIVTLGTVGAGDSLLDYVSAVSILPGGQIAVAGSSSPTSGHDTPAVEVLNADGSIDTGYGTNGLATVPLPSNAQSFSRIAPYISGDYYDGLTSPVNMVVNSNGEIVLDADAVLTGTDSEIVSTELSTTGAVDTSFGTGGQTTITGQSILPGSTGISGTALALQSNGGLIIGGSFGLPSSLGQMVVVRLQPNGTIDNTFGVGGANVLPTANGKSYYEFGEAVGAIAIQSDGKIVVADQSSSDFARLDPDGLPDTTFGAAGRAVIYQSLPDVQSGMSGQTNLAAGSTGLAITSKGEILVTVDDGLGGLRLLLSQGASGDYDGDGISDPSIYITSIGSFAYVPSTGVYGPIVQFGPAGVGQSLPAPGAYDGEGIDELGIYIPSLGAFAIKPLQGGQPILAPFGSPGAGNSLPAPGDYDASGATELGVYLPNLGIYAYRPASGAADVYVTIGTPGAGNSIPVPGDYFGTGQDDVAVYEPATASYVIRDPVNGQIYTVAGFGIPGAGNSIPVPGDYNGSGQTELAVYLPSLAELIYRPANGGPDVTIPFGKPGIGNTLPAPGDYDGSGKTEVAAYLPPLGIFAYHPADGNPDVYYSIGSPNQTIPYVLASATDTGNTATPDFAVSAASAPAQASVEIPLTPDMLDALEGTNVKKKSG